ncbi:hypothetical protein BJ741DRAFT_622048 [Chytriomyces cf. hyalinus JEL632]|nr:hypothetical protein BJ741DRAFT_622048 [Chytriomyces cf. hyalinus JEL632]
MSRPPLLQTERRESAPTVTLHVQRGWFARSTWTEYFIVITALLTLAMSVDTFWLSRVPSSEPTGTVGISQDAFSYGLRACDARGRPPSSVYPSQRQRVSVSGPPSRRNRRHSSRFNTTDSSLVTLIVNAFLWDGEKRVPDTCVVTGYGVILAVSQESISLSQALDLANEYARFHSLPAIEASEVEVIDVQGRVVSPGLVDMHSHAGVSSAPGFVGEMDVNEESLEAILGAQLRVRDAFNANDPFIPIIASGGVTTSLILPGSANLMGGEGIAIKMLSSSSKSLGVDEMNLNFGMNGEDDEPKWRYLKMACGENPKSGDGFPGSRLGASWLYRQRLEEARSTLHKQNEWCESADRLSLQFKDQAHFHLSERYAEPLKDESLVALLRGKALLQVHCYQSNDMEMMLRNKHEFGFNISAFHHATEAYLIAQRLASENIAAALFADHSIYKREAYLHSVNAGQILNQAGVKIAYKSDHPVTSAQDLIFEAQKAVHYGLDPDIAFAAVTSAPADLIGAGWRIGRVKEGYDADLVIWDRSPLQLGARPIRVFIDGFTAVSLPTVLQPPAPTDPVAAVTPQLAATTSLETFSITNIGLLYANETSTLRDARLVVEKGIVTCMGQSCQIRGKAFDLNGGVVIPGLIASGVSIGLREISSEQSTNDGQSSSQDVLDGVVRAKDGLRVGGNSKALQFAYRSGVLTAISVPDGEGMLDGISVTFRTGAEGYSSAIIQADTALHVNIGNSAKEPFAQSISTQFGRLRSLLGSPPESSPFVNVVNGNLPLVVTLHDPSDITKLVYLVKETAPKSRLVIRGGSGAWVVADLLAQFKIPIVLSPSRCKPFSWEKQWCRSVDHQGPTSYEILKRAGVDVAISNDQTDASRSLLFEAGWATVASSTSGGKVDIADAIGSVTWKVADAFGLEPSSGVGRIAVGNRAMIVGLDGGPIGFGYHVQILADGEFVTTNPKQE